MKKLNLFSKLPSLIMCGAVLVAASVSTTSCSDDEISDIIGDLDIDDDDDDDNSLEEAGSLVLIAERGDWHATWADGSDVIGIINSANDITPIEYSSADGAFVLEEGLAAVEAAEYYYVIYPYAEGIAFTEHQSDPNKVTYQYQLPTEQHVYYNDNGTVNTYLLRQNSALFGATTQAVDIVGGECELALQSVTASVKVSLSGLVPGTVITDVTLSADAISAASASLNISTVDGSLQSVASEDTIDEITVYVNNETIGDEGSLNFYVAVLPQSIADGTIWNVDVDSTDGDVGGTTQMVLTTGDLEAGEFYYAAVEVAGYEQVSYTLNGTSLEQTLIADGINYEQVSHLTLAGNITQEDMEFTRQFPVLSYVDLSNATSAVIPAYLYSDDTSGSANPYKDQSKCPASYTLKTFKFPMAFDTIEGYVFERCASLESVTLPVNLVTLNHSVFESCTSLWDVELPSCVEYIGSWTFESTCVPNLVIPAGVTFMGSGIFSSMKSYNGVQSITLMMNPANVTWNASSNNVFQSVSGTIEVRVPTAYVDAYKELIQLSLVVDQIVGI
ncbi:MAG: leucine-rich repeat domain-containing protein [Rikenellaceae bacterium]